MGGDGTDGVDEADGMGGDGTDGVDEADGMGGDGTDGVDEADGMGGADGLKAALRTDGLKGAPGGVSSGFGLVWAEVAADIPAKSSRTDMGSVASCLRMARRTDAATPGCVSSLTMRAVAETRINPRTRLGYRAAACMAAMLPNDHPARTKGPSSCSSVLIKRLSAADSPRHSHQGR